MNKNSSSASYAAAGVDITAGYKAVELMKKHVARTTTKGVCSDVGGFGGLFELDMTGMNRPVLVSGTDGVGTKLKLAFLMDRHDTVGIDCVAMCVNDVICVGAKPLFFLDYIACGKNFPEKIEQIVAGVAEGCVQSGAALIGGETAEMPGFYPEDEYDLAGYTTGVVDRSRIIDNSRMEAGDVVIGLASSGVHSNGFSLVRRVFGIDQMSREELTRPIRETFGQAYDQLLAAAEAGSLTFDEEAMKGFGDKGLGDVLLTPTKIYVKPVLKLAETVEIKGVAHITGGGFYENIPRCIPDGLRARINRSDVRVLPVFGLLAAAGGIDEHDMFNTYNMGVGMSIVVSEKDAEKALKVLETAGETAYIMGRIEKAEGEEKIILE